jgi:hypothetical protein
LFDRLPSLTPLLNRIHQGRFNPLLAESIERRELLSRQRPIYEIAEPTKDLGRIDEIRIDYPANPITRVDM